MSQPETIEASQTTSTPQAVVRRQHELVLPFLVRDRSGRHLDHPAHTEEQALAIVEYFTLNDPASRCYIMQNPGGLGTSASNHAQNQEERHAKG